MKTLVKRSSHLRSVGAGVAVLLLSASLSGLGAQEPGSRPGPAAIQPGAPGAESRALSPDELRPPERARHTEADVLFMQNMIHHHGQALVMSRLAPERTENDATLRLARRIQRSQSDEIAFMQRWLELRGEEAPEPLDGAAHMDGAHHAGHDAEEPLMAGMLTADELARLEAARGAEFDRLFLEFMIHHHEGALIMVDELFAASGAAQDTDIFRFASHVNSDQRIDIARMESMLREDG